MSGLGRRSTSQEEGTKESEFQAFLENHHQTRQNLPHIRELISQFHMSELNPLWDNSDLSLFTPVTAQSDVVATKEVPKELVPSSSRSAAEVSNDVQEHLQKVRDQRKVKQLEESRSTDRILKYKAQKDQPLGTQVTEALDGRTEGTSKASDSEEGQSGDEGASEKEQEKEQQKESEKEPKENPKGKDKNDGNKDLRSW